MNYSQIFEDFTKILCNMLKKCDVNDSVEVSNQINCIFTYYVTILPALSQLQVKDDHIIKALKNITKYIYIYYIKIDYLYFINTIIQYFSYLLLNQQSIHSLKYYSILIILIILLS